MEEISEKVNELIIDDNNKKLRLKFTIDNQLLHISIQDLNNSQNYFYENFFNEENLCEKHRSIKACDSIEEIRDHFIHIIKRNKYSIKRMNENELDLILKTPFFAIEVEIILELYKIMKK